MSANVMYDFWFINQGHIPQKKGGTKMKTFFRTGMFVLGMIFGAAFAHNFVLAGKPDKIVDGVVQVGGISTVGMIAVVIGLIVCFIIGITMRD